MIYLQILIFIIGELLALLIFKFIRAIYAKRSTEYEEVSPRERRKNAVHSVLKGMMERLFIYICLLNNLPQGLTILAALKLGTRLHEDAQNKVSNDYFLVGNLVSFLLAVIYYLVATSPQIQGLSWFS